MVQCAVSNCRSSYSYNKRHKINEKIHYFRVPKNLLEEYKKAIKHPNLKEQHYICHKHFLASDIRWKKEVLDPCGNVMASQTFERPRLKEGVIPTQFPDSLEYPSRTIKKRKSSKNRALINKKKSKQENMKENQVEQENSSSDFSSDSFSKRTSLLFKKNVQVNQVNQEDSGSDCSSDSFNEETSLFSQVKQVKQKYSASDCSSDSFDAEALLYKENVEVNQVEEENSALDHSSDNSIEENLLSQVQSNGTFRADEGHRYELFELYFSNEMSFNIPKSWCRCDIDENDFQAITFMQLTGRIHNNIVSTICRKKLVLYKDLTVHPFVMDIPMEIEKLNFTNKFVKSTQDIERLIGDFDKLKICEGTKIVSPILDLENSFGFRDCVGHLRHHYCTLILPTSFKLKHCLPCNKANLFLTRKIARLKMDKEL